MSTWAINGTPTTSLNVTEITLARCSQAPDELTIKLAQPFDLNALYPHGSAITLSQDGMVYFTGRCETDPRKADGKSECITVRALGPWWYLENRIYQQQWLFQPDPNSPATVAVPTTNVILGLKQDGTFATTGYAMTDALQFCINSGAGFQLGSIMPGINFPCDKGTDLTCAEVLHRCLRWTPDAVVWFNYAVSPPAINIQRRGALESVSLPAVQQNVKSVECEPMYSLLKDGVLLHYIVGDAVFPSANDQAGNVASFNVLEMTLKLAPSSQSIIYNKVEVIALSSFADGANDQVFWNSVFPFLAAADNVKITGGTWGNPSTCPSMLKPGYTLTDWMLNSQGIFSQVSTVTANVTYSLGGQAYSQQLSYNYTATNATNKTYTWGNGGSPAELPPSGLASAIWSACNLLHFQGRLMLVDAECGVGGALMGKTLNLTGGNAAWVNMVALIVGVTEDLFKGYTTVQFGPPPCLGAGDMLALARMNRIRVTADTVSAVQGQGQVSSSNTPSVGGAGSQDFPNGPPAAYNKLVVAGAKVSGGTDDSAKSYTVDPAGKKVTFTDGINTLVLDLGEYSTNANFALLGFTGWGTSLSFQQVTVRKAGDFLIIKEINDQGPGQDCGS